MSVLNIVRTEHAKRDIPVVSNYLLQQRVRRKILGLVQNPEKHHFKFDAFIETKYWSVIDFSLEKLQALDSMTDNDTIIDFLKGVNINKKKNIELPCDGSSSSASSSSQPVEAQQAPA